MVTPKGFVDEFMEFLKNYQVIGLAIAVIIGAAAGKWSLPWLMILSCRLSLSLRPEGTGKLLSFR